MYCSNCGKEMEDSAVFCDNCGNRLEIVTVINNNPRKRIKKFIVLVVLVIIVIIAGALLFMRKSEKGQNTAVTETMRYEPELEMAESEIMKSTEIETKPIEEEKLKEKETIKKEQITEFATDETIPNAEELAWQKAIQSFQEEVSEFEYAYAYACFISFVESIANTDFERMWELVPEEEKKILFTNNMKEQIEDYYKDYVNKISLGNNDTIFASHYEYTIGTMEQFLDDYISATTEECEIDYLKKFDVIYCFQGAEIGVVNNNNSILLPQDDVWIGYLDGKYYVVNYFLANRYQFDKSEIDILLDMYNEVLVNNSCVKQETNSNYGSYIGILTRVHHEADPNVGGYDYDYYCLDFGQTVQMNCDFYADEAIGILEADRIVISADNVSLEDYLDKQVIVTGRVIDSGISGGQQILVDSIQ